MSTSAGPPTKPRREEKKAATREALLEAAGNVFARQGYVATTVDEVAWEAGMTKGAVYSNFASKDALFAAVIERNYERRMLGILERVDWSAPATEQAASAGEQFLAIADPNFFRLTLEYMLNAARFPRGHDPLREGARRVKAAVIEAMAATPDFEMVMPTSELATAFFAIGDGVALQHMSDPEGTPDDLYIKMLTIFVRGLQASEDDRAHAADPPT